MARNQHCDITITHPHLPQPRLLSLSQESILVKGVAFKKTFSYAGWCACVPFPPATQRRPTATSLTPSSPSCRCAGFEMQPKSYTNCKIALLNVELELKREKENAEIRVDNVKDYDVCAIPCALLRCLALLFFCSPPSLSLPPPSTASHALISALISDADGCPG